MKSFFLHIREYLRWYVLCALGILSITLWFVVLHEDRHGLLTFSVLNVGQGDSLFIESPTGLQVLVDGGPNKILMSEISRAVPWYDWHIDMIVVTNPDKDHYEGFLPLLEKYSIDAEMESGTISKTDTYTLLEQKIKSKNIPQIIAKRGQVIDLGGGTYLQVFFPDRDVSGLSSNDGSLVMRLVYGDTSVMLQGDSTARIEEYLAQLDSNQLESTILKVGHHGSKTSSTEAYVTLVNPEWAVISSGFESEYGHPNQETLDIMQKLDIPVLDTCVMGRITFHSDGKRFTLENKNVREVTAGCKKL